MNYKPARSIPSLIFAILKSPASHTETTGLANLGMTERSLYEDAINKSWSDFI